MTEAASQLTLDLPHRPALGAEDFLVSRSNAAAADMMDRWPNWPAPAVIVVGPARAGKTHLANVWRLRSGAPRIAVSALREEDVPGAVGQGAALLEDLHAGIGAERVLFHLLNLSRVHKLSILLTSRQAPGELQIGLPDLASRLRALPVVTIAPPDDALLRAVLVKHFADRQLLVEPHVISYIALRMEQSMAAAAAVVAELDRMAMAAHRKVTRALAAEALARHAVGQG
ncbi:MAG TPA: DnaA/Hda family protein [Hyphomicrobiaceae bacterium]|jgi:chromosomal replication initiation ATPase DnaA|nr:DnaA/Hda family protein [Hyphomicrobiaceae bacterium]